jgi:Tol biopolymer transport system component
MDQTSARGLTAHVLARVSLLALALSLVACSGFWDAAGERLSFLAPSPAAPPPAPEPAAAAAEPAKPQIEPVLTGMRQLTFDGRRTGEGYFSADGKKLVFQSEREEGNPFYQIYLLDLESGDTRRISPGYGKTTCAWIHPAGDRVLFASTHADPKARAKQKDELEFRASGKERRYSWDYDENYDLYAASSDGKELKRLTRARGYDAEGSYSPDGTQIVFASNRHAYTEKLSASIR